MTNKHTKFDPSWFTQQWLYDELMRHIEPDLTSKKAKLLEKKYAKETDEEKELRMERYDLAFDFFDIALESFESEILSDVREWKKIVRGEAQAESFIEDEEKMEDLEEQINISDK
jgi:hypothetical protein